MVALAAAGGGPRTEQPGAGRPRAASYDAAYFAMSPVSSPSRSRDDRPWEGFPGCAVDSSLVGSPAPGLQRAPSCGDGSSADRQRPCDVAAPTPSTPAASWSELHADQAMDIEAAPAPACVQEPSVHEAVPASMSAGSAVPAVPRGRVCAPVAAAADAGCVEATTGVWSAAWLRGGGGGCHDFEVVFDGCTVHVCGQRVREVRDALIWKLCLLDRVIVDLEDEVVACFFISGTRRMLGLSQKCRLEAQAILDMMQLADTGGDDGNAGEGAAESPSIVNEHPLFRKPKTPRSVGELVCDMLCRRVLPYLAPSPCDVFCIMALLEAIEQQLERLDQGIDARAQEVHQLQNISTRLRAELLPRLLSMPERYSTALLAILLPRVAGDIAVHQRRLLMWKRAALGRGAHTPSTMDLGPADSLMLSGSEAERGLLKEHEQLRLLTHARATIGDIVRRRQHTDALARRLVRDANLWESSDRLVPLPAAVAAESESAGERQRWRPSEEVTYMASEEQLCASQRARDLVFADKLFVLNVREVAKAVLRTLQRSERTSATEPLHRAPAASGADSPPVTVRGYSRSESSASIASSLSSAMDGVAGQLEHGDPLLWDTADDALPTAGVSDQLVRLFEAPQSPIGRSLDDLSRRVLRQCALLELGRSDRGDAPAVREKPGNGPGPGQCRSPLPWQPYATGSPPGVESAETVDLRHRMGSMVREVRAWIGSTVRQSIKTLPGLESPQAKMRIRPSVEHYLFRRLCPALMPLYEWINAARDAQLRHSVHAMRSVSLSQLGVRPECCPASLTAQRRDSVDCSSPAQEQPPRRSAVRLAASVSDGDLRRVSRASQANTGPYQSAVDVLQRLPDACCPLDKLQCILQALRETNACAMRLQRHRIRDAVADMKSCDRVGGQLESAGCEELLLLFVFVVLQTRIPSFFAQMHFISDYVDKSLLLGEHGYALVTLQMALGFIETSALANESQD